MLKEKNKIFQGIQHPMVHRLRLFYVINTLGGTVWFIHSLPWGQGKTSRGKYRLVGSPFTTTTKLYPTKWGRLHGFDYTI